MEYLQLPGQVIFVLSALFLFSQIVGEFLELQGKVVPEIMKIRKYFARKKKEREIMASIPKMMEDTQKLVSSFEEHYSKDNIAMRDAWIAEVNHKLDRSDKITAELIEKIDKNNSDTLSILIDSKRNTIIDFASKVIDDDYRASREQFNRVFKLYDEYEQIIEENGLTNGEIVISYDVIKEAYEHRLKTHTFVEDVRGYNF